MPVFQLTEELVFPNPELADDEGLLAIGGDLSPERIVLAYKNGIFPWYNQEDPILWWCPNPRSVLFPSELKISKSMRNILNQQKFEITLNKSFREVINACKTSPRDDEGTWINDDIVDAYCKLNELGFAHSVEAWQNNKLVGGLYGIKLGNVFFGESMFHTVSNASKVAFITFVKQLESNGVNLIDCQVHNSHLESLGAELIPKQDFLSILKSEIE